jgi:hypothetical protein
MKRWSRVAVGAVVLVVLAGACSSSDDNAAPARSTTTIEARSTLKPTVDAATLEGPITVGKISNPADPHPADLAAAGYVEEEFFASGTATAYKADGDLGGDGKWSFASDTTAPYKTRFVVRRPAKAADFDGTVVVEWLNVSAVEASPEWSYTSRTMIDAHAAWVGVSVQALGVVGGTSLIQTGAPGQAAASTGIKGNNPERYGSLAHPGDAYSFDIYSQVGAALRSPAGKAVLGGAEPRWIVAAGESQSAAFLTTYHNAVQPLAKAFDGFFIHSRGSSGPGPDGKRAIGQGAPAVRLRTDLGVPVMVFETETDVGPRLRFAEARQPDNKHLRVWETAGTAHADAYLVGENFTLCPGHINNGPQHYTANAALESLLRWIGGGDPPAHGTPIEVDGTTVKRGEHGIALGGIRTPSVDVPISTLTGEAPAGAPVLCSLFGTSTPFDAATLKALYPTRAQYLQAFSASLDKAIAAGFVRKADRAMYEADAQKAPIT